MSPPRPRPDWELGIQQVLLAGGPSLPENDPEDRLRDLMDECWERRLSCPETAAGVIELLRLGPRKAWGNEVNRGMKELVALGVEEAWPNVLEEARARHQWPAETAREVCRLLHSKWTTAQMLWTRGIQAVGLRGE
jgi:hypothetical protein